MIKRDNMPGYVSGFCILILMWCSCKEEPVCQHPSEKGLKVVAKHNSSGQIDGVALYYDSSNNLVSKATFENGIKVGGAVNYSNSGKINDSFTYRDGRLHGNWFHFDSNGQIKFISNYYYGLAVGPKTTYFNGVIANFSFTILTWLP